jgi:hypothetical protein
LALNNKGVRGCELSQDTHEFWEAAGGQKGAEFDLASESQ